MTSPTLSMIERYASRGVIVDTNILLLYFVGELNKERITRFKRTKQFAEADYVLLSDFLKNFRQLITTPNILTEVSSLINQLGEPDRSACYAAFAGRLEVLNESYIQSQSIASPDWTFLEYGLTDCGIVALAREGYLVLTDDLKAASYFLSQGLMFLISTIYAQTCWRCKPYFERYLQSILPYCKLLTSPLIRT